MVFGNGNGIQELKDNHLHEISQKLDKIIEDCENATYMTPKEAIEYGLIDKVIAYAKWNNCKLWI